jgi:hypothetical protein
MSAVINKAAICAIQKGGLKHIDEWVDYNLVIGFDTIFLYDNSDNFELQEWYSVRFFQLNKNETERVQIIHHRPGESQQHPAYNSLPPPLIADATNSYAHTEL